MIRRRHAARTGFELSEYGLGAWALGGRRYGPIEERTAIEVCRAYVEAGGNLIDTARVYENSERVLGSFLKDYGRRESLFIASKTEGGKEPGTVGQIRADLAVSLRELQTDYLDIYYLHQPPEDSALMGEALEEMIRLREEGVIRAVGASVKGPNVTAATQDLCLRYIASDQVDFLQVVYSILRQANAGVIEEASRRGVGIVARTTLESGLLTGAFSPGHRFQEPDQRARYDPRNLDYVLREVERTKQSAVRPPYGNLAQVALRFALLHPGVTSIIVGAERPQEVRANLAAAALPPLPADIADALRRTYGSLTERANYFA
jgi:aryl-alcohol dehydrogenase-like predicted oxidoreductase